MGCFKVAPSGDDDIVGHVRLNMQVMSLRLGTFDSNCTSSTDLGQVMGKFVNILGQVVEAKHALVFELKGKGHGWIIGLVNDVARANNLPHRHGLNGQLLQKRT